MELPPEHPHTAYAHEPGHDRGPYWKRAHRDWKVWVAVILMLTAMWVYLRSNDLSHAPNSPPQQPVP
jgi:hypothetical protein